MHSKLLPYRINGRVFNNQKSGEKNMFEIVINEKMMNDALDIRKEVL